MTDQDDKLSRAIELIAGSCPKKLFYNNLRILCVEHLRTKHNFDANRRKTSDVRTSLSNVKQAAKTLLESMYDVETVSYLNQVGPNALNYLHVLIPSLEDVARRAEAIAAELPDGAGRQRYKAGEFSIDAMRLCTIIVIEAWKIEHEKNPSPYNEKLWEAADLIWISSGGTKFSSEDSLERWKKYFVEMSKTNFDSVHYGVVRQLLDLRPIEGITVHTTEFGTE